MELRDCPRAASTGVRQRSRPPKGLDCRRVGFAPDRSPWLDHPVDPATSDIEPKSDAIRLGLLLHSTRVRLPATSDASPR
jgi:hypothetical protein